MGRKAIFDKNEKFFCLVCNQLTRGRNFGVLSCLACAAFFRKSIVERRTYKCKRGKNCHFNWGQGRNRCRLCRLKKCFDVGMQEKLVQTQKNCINGNKNYCRNIIKKISQKDGNRKNCGKEENNKKLELEEPISRKKEKNEEEYGKIKKMANLMRKLRSVKNCEECFEAIDLNEFCSLEEFLENDQVLGALEKWITENATIKNNAVKKRKKIKREDYFEIVNRLGITPIVGNDFWLMEQMIGAEFLKALPNFQQLETADKIKLFQRVIRPAILMLCAFFSIEECLDALTGNKAISPVWIYSSKTYENDEKVKQWSQSVYVDFLEAIKRIKPTNDEFIFILSLLLAHFSTPNLSKQSRELLQFDANKISANLMRFQQQIYGIEEAPIRYYDTINLISAAFDAANEQEQLEIYVDLHYLDLPKSNWNRVPKAFRQIHSNEPKKYENDTNDNGSKNNINTDIDYENENSYSFNQNTIASSLAHIPLTSFTEANEPAAMLMEETATTNCSQLNGWMNYGQQQIHQSINYWPNSYEVEEILKSLENNDTIFADCFNIIENYEYY